MDFEDRPWPSTVSLVKYLSFLPLFLLIVLNSIYLRRGRLVWIFFACDYSCHKRHSYCRIQLFNSDELNVKRWLRCIDEISQLKAEIKNFCVVHRTIIRIRIIIHYRRPTLVRRLRNALTLQIWTDQDFHKTQDKKLLF